MKLLIKPLFFCISLALSSTAYSQTTKAAPLVQQVIVKLRAPLNAQSTQLSRTQLGQIGQILTQQSSLITGLPLNWVRSSNEQWHILKLPQALTEQEARLYAQQIALNPEVEIAEPDSLRYPATITPNDPNFYRQTYLQDYSSSVVGLNLPSAWQITTGSADITVAVLDTGLVDHSDILTNVWGQQVSTSGYDFISDPTQAADGNGRDSNPFDEGDQSVSDGSSSWHGLFVAGIIGAKGNNSLGMTGISWNGRLLNVRVLGKGGGLTSDIADAMRWAAGLSAANVPTNTHPAKVINLSLGTVGTCSATEQSAINDALAQGVVVVVAAGNQNIDTSQFTPANCQGVIVVGALDNNGARASYSNYGTKVDLSTPGTVYSLTNLGAQTPILGGSGDAYAYGYGTSFAAPLVSGTVSLMLAANSKLTDGTVAKTTIPTLIKMKLRESTRAFSNIAQPACLVGSTNTTCPAGGTGILDVWAAVKAVSTAPTANAGTNQNTTPNTKVTLNGLNSSDDGSIVRYQWVQTAGSSVTLSNASSALPSFTSAATPSTYTFALTVTDDVGLTSAADTVTIYASTPTPTPTP
ncbi:MAG: S8 family serine peptidase, partial [Thiofilum sp.]